MINRETWVGRGDGGASNSHCNAFPSFLVDKSVDGSNMFIIRLVGFVHQDKCRSSLVSSSFWPQTFIRKSAACNVSSSARDSKPLQGQTVLLQAGPGNRMHLLCVTTHQRPAAKLNKKHSGNLNHAQCKKQSGLLGIWVQLPRKVKYGGNHRGYWYFVGCSVTGDPSLSIPSQLLPNNSPSICSTHTAAINAVTGKYCTFLTTTSIFWPLSKQGPGNNLHCHIEQTGQFESRLV